MGVPLPPPPPPPPPPFHPSGSSAFPSATYSRREPYEVFRKHGQIVWFWLHFVCFEAMCAEACRAPVMQPIVLLILLFPGRTWLIHRARFCYSTLPLKMAICRGLPGVVVLCYPQKLHVHFLNLGDIRMACWRISGRAVTSEQRSRGSHSEWLPCGAAVTGRCVQTSDKFIQVESSTVRMYRNTLPGDFLKSNCMFPDSCLEMKEPRLPEK